MGKEPIANSRDERLAARLRENLHRRKAQARNLAAQENPTLCKDRPNS
jgi:hypothetical protein